jgi:hypothetical protein
MATFLRRTTLIRRWTRGHLGAKNWPSEIVLLRSWLDFGIRLLDFLNSQTLIAAKIIRFARSCVSGNEIHADGSCLGDSGPGSHPRPTTKASSIS